MENPPGVLEDSQDLDENLDTLDVAGVSIHHLQTIFMEQIQNAGLDRTANIHRIENLQGPPGVIRKSCSGNICPIDGRMGSSYAHSLSGEDNVGKATHILSYSWSYRIGEILDSLVDFCLNNKLNPKKTYIWIDCLCINQHRVVEQKEKGGTGLLNFEQEFPIKLRTIGHMLAMMTPWEDPTYLTRLWCVFEMYCAHANGCKVDVIMPPKEKRSLKKDVLKKKGGIGKLYMALGRTKVQNADATVESDQKVILGMIESTVGCQQLNNEVNELLRGWIKQALLQAVESQRSSQHSIRYARSCHDVGLILRYNGDYDGALEQYLKCLEIEENILGKNHPETATTYSNIGSLLHRQGRYDDALDHYNKCLAIEEVFNFPTAMTYSDIGSVMNSEGDYDGALQHHRQCLVILEATLGKDNFQAAETHRRIGLDLKGKGDYDGALEYFQQCLAIQLEVFGKDQDHPDIATTHGDIGSVMHQKGDLDRAIKQHQKCLVIQEALLGKDHPNTAITYSNLALVSTSQGDLDTALEYYDKCLAVRMSKLGPDHHDTKACQQSMEELEQARAIQSSRAPTL